MKKYLLISILLILAAAGFSQQHYPDVVNYEINLDISDFNEQTISGYTELTITTTDENIELLALDLLRLSLDSVRSEDLSIGEVQYNDSLLLVEISPALQSGDTVQLRVYYHGTPVIDPSGWGGFYFNGQRAYNLGVGFEDIPHNYGRVWFPCVDNFTDRATYRCKITVLENHTAVCGGLLINTGDPQDGKRTFEWFLGDEIPTYLASVAVGEYSLAEHTYHGMERDIPVQIWVYPTQLNSVAGTFVHLDSIVSIYEHTFGPYAWERIGYVSVPFNSGAMEHATNISLPYFAFSGNTSYEDLVAHEFAHHWFGDLITCSTAEDMWINEGWATYCESVYREFLYGRTNMLNYRREYHSEVLRYAHIEDGSFLTLNDIPIDRTYCTTAYEKGASVAHALRGYLGDDLFFGAITAFIQANRFNDVSSYEMRDFLTTYTGIDMSDWFDAWVFTPGFPHYSIDSVTTVENGGGYQSTVYVKQKMRGRNFMANSNKVPVSFLNAQYSDTTCFVFFDGETGSAVFQLNEEPKLVMCDYHETISDATIDQNLWLKNTNTVNLSRLYVRIKPTQLSADSIYIRITHNWVPPDTMQTQIPGLFLANNRFWLIEGDFNQHSVMKGEFQYGNTTVSSLNGYLDNEFINNSLDSLVLMYRLDHAHEWQIVESSNSTVLKRLTTENMIPGEYALGIKNWDAWLTVASRPEASFAVFPNPACDRISIRFEKEESGKLRLFNSLGALVSEESVDNVANFSISLSGLPDGVYFVQFDNRLRQQVTYNKIIISR